MIVQEEVKTRSEVEPSDKWDVSALFHNDEEWEKTFAKSVPSPTSPHWPKLSAFQGKLNTGAATVKSALQELLSIQQILERLYTYAHLRHDEEITVDTYKSAYERISAVLHLFQQEVSWFEPELLSLPQETLNSYLHSSELAPYRFYLEKIVRLRPHTLSAEQEGLLATMGRSFETASKAFSSLNNADIKFSPVPDSKGQPHPLSHGLYQLYMRSNDRYLRAASFKQMHDQFLNMENTLCELLSGEVNNHFSVSKSRKYTSCLEAALFPKNIPVAVYHSLIAAVRSHLPSLHRYVKLRKKILGVDVLHLYDMYVPLIPEVDIKIDYPEAEKLVVESAAPLGKEYQSMLQQGLYQDHWVDRFENKNKRSGAYSSGCYGSLPYILMNYRGTLRDVYTLAHEAGHSMHSLLSNKKQPYHDSFYPIFVAEVASTFNEELLTQLLLKTFTSDKEKSYLLNEKIEDIRTTLFRQTLFAEFELKIHELVEKGTPLTPSLLKELFLALNHDYFGPAAYIDKEIAIEWGRIPHFYYNFYVFQYATGISAALSLAQKVLEGGSEATEAYLTFLKGGGSKYPIDLLKVAGVDMTAPEPVEKAIQKFDYLVSELEQCKIS